MVVGNVRVLTSSVVRKVALQSTAWVAPNTNKLVLTIFHFFALPSSTFAMILLLCLVPHVEGINSNTITIESKHYILVW